MALKPAQLVPYLQLMRLPNAITAIADVSAGLLLAGATLSHLSQWCWLAPASFCLYAGGVTLNDVCDRAVDQKKRPERPIPSGRVSHTVASMLASALLLIGLALAAQCGLIPGLVCGALVVTIVLYNATLKSTRLAPGVMGACRTLNLGLGVTGVAGTSLLSSGILLPLVLMWFYVTSVTYFARREAEGGNKRRLILGACGLLGAMSAVLLVRPFAGGARIVFLLVVVASVAYLAALATRAVTEPTPANVQRSVGRFVLGIVVLDALFVWTARGPWLSAMVLLLLVPSVLLARRIRMS